MHNSDRPPNAFGPHGYNLFDSRVLQYYTAHEVLELERARIRLLREYTDVLNNPGLMAEAHEHFTGTTDEIVRAYLTRRNEMRTIKLGAQHSVEPGGLQYAAEFYGVTKPNPHVEDVTAGFARRTEFLAAIEAADSERS